MNKLLAILALIGAFSFLPVDTASAGVVVRGGVHARCGVRVCHRPVVRVGFARACRRPVIARRCYGPRFYCGPRVVCRRPGIVVRI